VPKDKPFVVARVRRPHGVRGEVLCYDVTDGLLDVEPGAEGLLKLETGEASITVESFRRTPKGVLYKLSGINDRSTAETIKGAEILLPAAAAPELDDTEFYAHELEGLPVYDEEDKFIGRVTGFIETAANEILVIDRDGEEYLVPLVWAHIVSISPGDRIVVVDVPWE
jgi:16S rRNA processing protein RimM